MTHPHVPFNEDRSPEPQTVACTRYSCVTLSLTRADDTVVCPTCSRKCLRACCHRSLGYPHGRATQPSNNTGTLPRVYTLAQGSAQ